MAEPSKRSRRGRGALLAALFVALVMPAVVSRAGQPAPATPAPIYKQRQTVELGLHLAMTRIAEQVAHKKLNHEPLEAVAAEFDRKNADSELRGLVGALVKKVYEDEFSDAAAYALDFFKESALRLAEVPADRLGPATLCAQNALAADRVFTYRLGGLRKDKVTKLLAEHHMDVPREIIDRVYGAPLEQPGPMLQVWNDCMAPWTEAARNTVNSR